MDNTTPLDSGMLPPEEQQGRPRFLSVLCILTYIGVGLGVISSIIAWWGMYTMQQAMVLHGNESQATSAMLPAIQYASPILAISIIGNILCLVGAIQMWNLKKLGFYIYAIGEVGPAIVSLVLLGGSTFGGLGLIGLVIPVIFIALYGVNLKHLK